jgi:hypothetical protein
VVTPNMLHPQFTARPSKLSHSTPVPSSEKSSMAKYTCLMQRLVTSDHVTLPSSRLYTLISIFADATPQQILGLKPVIWELDNTGHSLRQSQIITIIIIIKLPCNKSHLSWHIKTDRLLCKQIYCQLSQRHFECHQVTLVFN